MQVSQVETNFYMGALLTILQGSVLLHYMPRIFYDLGIDPIIATTPPSFDSAFYIHAVASAILLALPGLLTLMVDKVAVPLEKKGSQTLFPGCARDGFPASKEQEYRWRDYP